MRYSYRRGVLFPLWNAASTAGTRTSVTATATAIGGAALRKAAPVFDQDMLLYYTALTVHTLISKQ
jgi:hypothetical protein